MRIASATRGPPPFAPVLRLMHALQGLNSVLPQRWHPGQQFCCLENHRTLSRLHRQPAHLHELVCFRLSLPFVACAVCRVPLGCVISLLPISVLLDCLLDIAVRLFQTERGVHGRSSRASFPSPKADSPSAASLVSVNTRTSNSSSLSLSQSVLQRSVPAAIPEPERRTCTVQRRAELVGGTQCIQSVPPSLL